MKTVSKTNAEAFTSSAFQALGMPEADARRAATLMVRADLTGADAHGIFRLPAYAERFEAGGMNPQPQIVVDRRGPAVALVDGGNGLGHLVMARATQTAIELARECGVGWVGIHHSNHAGPAALYVEMALEHGMASIYSAVASSNHMAPWGGAESLLGTNPVAFAIPAGEEPPIVFDIATTVVSYGMVKHRALTTGELPEGWLVDATDGSAVTDPAKLANALLLPMGGYKGSGLALALGLLAGPMNGAAFGRDVVDFNADKKTETNTGHFIVVVDVARFVEPETFKSEMDRHIRTLRESKPLPGVGPVRLPGEARAQRLEERSRAGITLSDPLLARLDTLAERLGVAPIVRAD